MPDLTRFKDRHAQGRCVIVCNGPSLNRMDLSLLRHEIVIGLNKIYLGLDRFGFYPKYLVAVNEKVITQSVAEFAKMNCIKFIGERGAYAIPEGSLTYHLATKKPPHRFCKDISVGLREGGTVTYAALQIAYYMGFSEVIIVGMDHSFQYSGAPHETRKMEGPDPNHFSPSYFGGQLWDNPDLERSEESYRIARKVFEADGRRIIDATLNGACDIFEKTPYSDVFCR